MQPNPRKELAEALQPPQAARVPQANKPSQGGDELKVTELKSSIEMDIYEKITSPLFVRDS
ncbi:MAG: hypothetical protein AOA65_1155 [Candidatus Bathyarchaeota archaeon BA1]|nr:MAG: hypothetical protein AOA65_1155 [Candidatus Bathyarchaeota archaeon BA1]